MHKKSSPLAWRNSKQEFKLASDFELSGTIESFTVVYNAPKGFENQVPYILALILLSNRERITSQIVDCKEVSIGAKVVPCLRRVHASQENGLISYGVKFRVENEI